MRLTAFFKHRGGAAAVEFALIIPTIMLLYYGMVEGTQAMLAKRRAGYLTTAVGDLVTQKAQVSAADVDGIFAASTAVLKPFPTDDIAIRVTSIQMDETGKPIKVWTRAQGTIPEADLASIPDSLKQPNMAIVRAETIYKFKTPFQRMLPGEFEFKHKMDVRPRTGVAVPLIE
jgi:Flp pilus assembly protein TadG